MTSEFCCSGIRTMTPRLVSVDRTCWGLEFELTIVNEMLLIRAGHLSAVHWHLTSVDLLRSFVPVEKKARTGRGSCGRVFVYSIESSMWLMVRQRSRTKEWYSGSFFILQSAQAGGEYSVVHCAIGFAEAHWFLAEIALRRWQAWPCQEEEPEEGKWWCCAGRRRRLSDCCASVVILFSQ